MSIIYKATNQINQKVYIGHTTNFNKRKYHHIWEASQGEGHYFHRALTKHGADNFLWEIIYENEDAKDKETFFIQEYKSNQPEFGYNLTLGGEGSLGWIPSEETRRKISEANKGNNNCRGRVMSEETKKKISLSKIGKPLSPEHIEKLKLSNKGRIRSPETIAKTVATRKSRGGYAHSEETKKKIGEANKKHVVSPEQIEILRNNARKMIGIPRSEDVKMKISDSHKLLTFTPEHLNKIRVNNRTRDKSWMQTPEYKEKMSKALKGQKRTPEQIERYRLAAIKRWKSTEYRENRKHQ